MIFWLKTRKYYSCTDLLLKFFTFPDTIGSLQIVDLQTFAVHLSRLSTLGSRGVLIRRGGIENFDTLINSFHLH